MGQLLLHSLTSQPAEKDMATSVIPFNLAELKYWHSITSANDLNNLADGIYYVTTSAPQHAPAVNCVWCVVYQITITASMIHQYIIKPDASLIWVREFSGNPSSWLSWKKFTGTNV